METGKHARQAGVVVLRRDVRPGDPAVVEEIVRSTGFFREDEVTVAVELVQERLDKGAGSGYEFIFAKTGGRTVGYSCFGLIPCTLHSFDLYWIAVAPGSQGSGLGRRLMAEAEGQISRHGGKRVYVDTSSRPQYLPTRGFYEALGYQRAAYLPDFYAPGDGRVIYCKMLE